MDKNIKFLLLVPRFKLFRLDVYPFILLYILLIYAYMQVDPDSDFNIYIRLTFIGVGFFNCLTYIFGHWSKKAKAMIQFKKLSGNLQQNLQKASHVYIVEKKQGYNHNYGIVDFCKEENNGQENYFFIFQLRKFYYNFDTKNFERMKPLLNITFRQILQSPWNQKLQKQYGFYDNNILEIPIRPFWDIYRQQIIDPFNFFQLFSVFLWMLDDNRIYCLMILVMLLGSAYAISIQRIKTLVGFRSMTLAPHQVYAYRDTKWVRIPSYELKPSDIVVVQPGYQHKQSEYQMKTDEQYLSEVIPFGAKFPGKQPNIQQKKPNSSYRNIPCDILLLSGICVANQSILTGQAIPQIKQSISTSQLPKKYMEPHYKQNVLFCGTQVLQINDQADIKEINSLLGHELPKPPVNGCIGMVLTTGFDTSKGKLIRKVIGNTESLSIEQKDGLWIILFLLICSLFTSAYVLKEGMKNESRSKQKLFLRCILIITTVVPPQLPMILTLAVNNSIMYLQKKQIFVSEPKKIPLGGKVNIIAFDKTGTLTEDKFVFQGIVDNLKDYKKIKQIKDADVSNSWVLAGCHSIISVDRQLTGDPIELMFFDLSKQWTYTSKNKEARFNTERINIKKIYTFKSQLKRMTTLVEHVDSYGRFSTKVLTKGAPEAIEKLLDIIPNGYKQAYTYYTKQGYRLLALAYRNAELDEFKKEIPRDQQREKAQKNLIFAGFFICTSPLKQDTLVNIKKLQKAAYKILIITGDNILTAIKVGLTLEMGVDVVIVQRQQGKIIVAIDQDTYEIKDTNDLKKYIGPNTLVCTSSTRQLPRQFYPYITIFARTSPNDKQIIVKEIKDLTGQSIMYAGDGTNDVGGLRMADVGVAVVGTTTLTEVTSKQEELKQEQKEFQRRRKAVQNDVRLGFSQKIAAIGKLTQQQMLKKKQNQLNFMIGDDIKVGDACIAAPFTSKHSNSIKCVLIIIRQAVATLVTTIQTYKILAISSMLQAYSLAEMNMTNLKYSQKQSMVMGILASINFYYFSNAKPLKQISHIRAPHTIFNIWFGISFFGQIIIFLGCNYYALNCIGLVYVPEQDKNLSADNQFKKSFVNTVIFLFLAISQSAVFIVNHGGEPHMTSLLKNSRYFKFLVIPLVICFVLTANIFQDFSQYIDLKFDGVPYEANIQMLVVFGVLVGSSFLLDRLCRFAQYRQVVGWF